MKNYLLLLLLTLPLFFACKEKKTSMKDDEVVTVTDFIEFFPEVGLTFQLADTTLRQKTTDSLLIGNKTFHQFIPDSLLKKDFGATARPKLYALGRVKEKDRETYLFFKAVAGSKRVGYLVCFSEKEQFLQGMPLVRDGFDSQASAYGQLDKKFQITTYRDKKQAGQLSFKRNVYFYNNTANEFTLIFTEPNEEIIANVINPIDTLAAKHKFAGEYVKDKRNFVSVRDGKSASEVLVFVHFEKNGGECKGELKGMARFVSNNVAVYQESGNPCSLQLSFSKTAVSLKETGGCGSYRDIRCFFEGSYPRKKAPKPESGGKKK
ncbi:MAG: hypothetical protein P0Y53_11315 [Candidatus Pseudobacter hemicellulosilyticus]|uniref:Lipoprotein n=1 Tax=Candidatus Pseudobacter hemicellulosilyticus TaxID=3121375 RepID=A0AAJ5WYV6_9BACT|nr:MAG: hypothetical protein P0Y53_11315 [Pseudobacter sp.]